MANGNGNGDYSGDDTGYSMPMPAPAEAIYPQNQLAPPTQVASVPTPAPTSVLPPTPPPGPIEDWNYDSSLGRWVKNITPTAQSNALQPTTTQTAAAPVQPTRFDMTFGDSLATQQSTNRINPRMANNRIWGVEGPQYGKNSLPIGQSPSDAWTTNEVGAPTSRIADRAEYLLKQNPDFFSKDANGNPINNFFVSSGSNSPDKLDDVGRLIDTIKKANPNARIVIPGMGPGVPTQNVVAANAALKQVVESHGGIFFQPNLQYADGVHPANSGHMFDQANTALSTASPPTPPTTTVSATASGTIPGEAPQAGLPQPGQPQAPGRNALQPGATQPQGVSTAIAPINVPVPLANLVNYWADYYGVDRNVFARMIGHESGFVTNAQGTSGEVGLGQLMPGTAVHVGVKDRTDPSENLRGSAQYLREMLDNPRAGGDYRKALQLYNHGPASKIAFNNFDYADAVLTGHISEGAGSSLPPGTNRLMPGGQGQQPGVQAGAQAGAQARQTPGGVTPADIMAQANARNEQMRRLALYNYVAQALKANRVNPEALQSGYDPGKVLHGALEPVDRSPVSIREGAPLQMPRFEARPLSEPRLLQVPQAARQGYAQLLPRKSNIEGI